MALPLSKTKRLTLSRLGTRKMREKFGLFLVEGWKSVKDLFDNSNNKIRIEYIVSLQENLEDVKRHLSEIEDIYSNSCKEHHNQAECGLPEIYVVTSKEMREISSLSVAPEVIAVCKLPIRKKEEEILASPLPEDLYLLLDGVQDPGNLGTIIRTAHWFGVNRIFASYDTVDLYNPKTVQSTMGSLGSVSVDYVDLSRLIADNPDKEAAGLLLEGKNIFHTELPSSAFIIMGNEGNGISEALRKKLTMGLTIPPHDPRNHSESLNVAIASAITLAAFRK